MPPMALRSALLLVMALAASPAPGADPLRWRLAEGDRMAYRCERSSRLAGGGGELEGALDETLDYTWEALEVEGGVAKIEQRVVKLRASSSGTLGESVFDSASDAAPSGVAALAAPVYQAMLEAPVRFTLSRRGEPRGVEPGDPLAQALMNAPGAESTSKTVTAANRLVLSPWAPLPQEGIEPGSSVEMRLEMPVAGVGLVTLPLTVRRGPDRKAGGKELVTLVYSADSAEVAALGKPAGGRITRARAEGQLLFDPLAGRLEGFESELTLGLELASGGPTSQGTVEVSLRIEPRKAEPKGGPAAGETADQASGAP